MVYGNAGAVLALDALYKVHPDAEVLAIMEACGRHILSQARPVGGGLAWASKTLDCPPLAGYSHGASGIAAALEVLYQRTEEEPYRQAASGALAYERTLFSEEQGNWRDLRIAPVRRQDGTIVENYPVAWCNGAAGIGLARLRMTSLRDAIFDEEIDAALRATRRHGFGYNHCLCHGDLGNIELLIEAEAAGHPSLGAHEVASLTTNILEVIERQGWICGTPRGVETPGLMTGLAGIGYGLLRLYDPVGTPSVIMLDPPRRLGLSG